MGWSFSKEAKLSRVPNGDSCLKIITATTRLARSSTTTTNNK
uniref:Uncharacterized protein n=1 Tax=Arundo donax TaxID=35708 RepID=A0A0A8ZWT5_ARUDO